MQIIDMATFSSSELIEAAKILADTLDYPDAMDEIRKRLIPENTLLAAMEDGTVLGWGGILAPIYGGNVFELHPLAVRRDKQRMGIGRKIVEALESAAREQGGLTIYLGADDDKEGGETSLAHSDLYDDLPGKLRDFSSGIHQSGFYMRMGYKIIGVMPDANGIGKPDIFWAKRL